ncbi:MAG: class I SAM-dependent methyltransferase [Pseudobdellovibrionaceae bacterium]
MDNSLGPKGQFREKLTPLEAKAIDRGLSDFTGQSIGKDSITAAQDFVGLVREKMVGRLAGDIDDYILLYYLCRHLQVSAEGDTLPHVEIGSLFGASSIVALKGFRDGGKTVPLLCIDPLDGYYVHQQLGGTEDSISKLPINRQTLDSNLATFGFGDKDFSVLQHLSTDAKVSEFLKGKKIRSAYIDGDHSYEGLRYDWNLLAPLVVQNGWIVIDNVFDVGWPDVSRFIFEKLIDKNGWKFSLQLNRSLVLTRIEGEDDGPGRMEFVNTYRIFKKYWHSAQHWHEVTKKSEEQETQIEDLNVKLKNETESFNKNLAAAHVNIESLHEQIKETKGDVVRTQQRLNATEMELSAYESLRLVRWLRRHFVKS